LQLVELAQLLHAMQQQQMSNESVVNETLAQMALQLKQQEQAQAQQARHREILQDRLDEVVDAIVCIQQQQQQQQQQQEEKQKQQPQVDSNATAHQPQLASQKLADVQGQQQALLGQLEQLRQEQQDTVHKLRQEQQQWQQEQLGALQRLQQEQALWREQQQQVLGQLQQQANTLQQEQQSWRHKQEQALQAIQQQVQDLQHTTSKSGEMQELQRQQQNKDSTSAIRSLQERIQQLTEQLQAVQCQQQELCSKASAQPSDGSAAADTCIEHQAAVSHSVLDQAVAELERRLLHAVRVEGEAGQQLLELRVTAMYEHMKGAPAGWQLGLHDI
jgi:hypothetical protein